VGRSGLSPCEIWFGISASVPQCLPPSHAAQHPSLIRNAPRQQHDDESQRHQRGEDDRALRPRTESGDKWRDGDVGRRVANVQIISAEPQIDRHDEAAQAAMAMVARPRSRQPGRKPSTART
jgi:hypothetical protein